MDCAGVVNGIAKKDVCSVCAGGATGVIPITDASLCGGGKVGIKGPLCVEIGKSYKYTITTENIPVSNISWWSSSGATTTKTIGNDKEMTVLIPSYLTGSTAMFAGVNYTKNPYYKSYSLLVKVGGCAASAALSLRVEASPLPFDQTTVLTLENQETINAIVLMDINGLEVYRAENISSDSFEIGKELTPGMYLAHVYSSQGISVKKLMKLN